MMSKCLSVHVKGVYRWRCDTRLSESQLSSQMVLVSTLLPECTHTHTYLGMLVTEDNIQLKIIRDFLN